MENQISNNKKMLNIVIFEPEIPQNTGNIARTCATTGARLHLVKPFGFEITDRNLKRAGLDYWYLVDITYYDSIDDFFEKTAGGDNLAGCIFIGWVHPEHRSATISYWLGQNFTGRGLATEALNLLCKFCFEALKLNRLEITAAVENKASIALAKRCGFKEEGVSRDFECLRGQYHDHLRLSKLARD